ncbi:MAG: methyltransferase domain-containing protein [Bdellovibrionota bacterium]
MQKILSLAKRSVPPAWRPKLKEWYFDTLLLLDSARGVKYEMVPPVRMNFVGTRHDFLEVGKEFLGHFQKVGKLQPQEKVLDIGCGIGRMAIPLTTYLDQSKGSYCGFDIIPFGIKWCRERITPRFPRFEFTYADIHNSAYNPGGKIAPADYRFPYSDNTFDFSFATSVFTHLVQPSMENYLRELHRVLKPGGRALLTFFILNDRSRAAIAAKKAHYLFTHKVDQLWTDNPASPEWAIAAEEEWLEKFLAKTGLELDRPIHFGRWCGTENPLSFQDVIIVRKPKAL